MEDRIKELERENTELKNLLTYYHGAEELLEKAEYIMDESLKAEEELQKAAEEFDTYAFEQENKLKERENEIAAKERETQKALKFANQKKASLMKVIEEKANEKINIYKRTGICIIIGITIFYTIIWFLVWLFT